VVHRIEKGSKGRHPRKYVAVFQSVKLAQTKHYFLTPISKSKKYEQEITIISPVPWPGIPLQS
jgi:hypothetical protein